MLASQVPAREVSLAASAFRALGRCDVGEGHPINDLCAVIVEAEVLGFGSGECLPGAQRLALGVVQFRRATRDVIGDLRGLWLLDDTR